MDNFHRIVTGFVVVLLALVSMIIAYFLTPSVVRVNAWEWFGA